MPRLVMGAGIFIGQAFTHRYDRQPFKTALLGFKPIIWPIPGIERSIYATSCLDILIGFYITIVLPISFSFMKYLNLSLFDATSSKWGARSKSMIPLTLVDIRIALDEVKAVNFQASHK